MYTTVVGGTITVAPNGVRTWSHGEDGIGFSANQYKEAGALNYGLALQLFVIEAAYRAGKQALYFLDSGNRVLFGIDVDGKWFNG